MRIWKTLCVMLALALALGGAAFAEETAPVDAPVEEVEMALGEDEPAEGEDAPMDAPTPDEAPPEDAEDGEPSGPLTALALPKDIVIGVGEERQLAPAPTPEDAVYTLSFTSDKKKVAAVDQATGLVTGKKKGSAVVTATADNGVKAAVRVKVAKAPKKVSLKAPTTVGMGDRFTCRVTYDKGAGGGWTLKSSEADVLRVEPDGSVTALARGSAKLTVTSYNGLSASATVKVLAAPTAIWLDRTEAEVGEGGALQLTAGFPEGEGGVLTFSSSDAGVASVDAAGRVTGVKQGSAVITARTTGGLEDACSVKVLPAPKSLAVPSKSVSLGVGQQAQLVVTPKPEGSACSLTYKSSKPKVATVTADGVLTGKKKGKSVVTVTAQNGVKVKVKVQVLAAPKKVSLSLERSKLAPGETTRAVCKLPKKTAAGLAFSSDNEAVATVDPSGKVTAVAVGTAKITVTTSNGLTASAKLTVEASDPGDDDDEDGDPGEVSGLFEITFMNIGRNDGILMHCGGEWAFIDSGLHGRGVQAVKYMRKRGVDKLKYYIGTHAHKDHVGGAPYILSQMSVDQVIVSHSGTARAIKSFAENDAEKRAARSANYRVVKRGQKFYLGGAEFLVLGPVKITKADIKTSSENINSLVLRATFGSNTFLLTGDATGAEFKQIQKADPGCLKAQVYKNPHHYAAITYAAKLCHPEITVFSTSKKGQPSSGYVRLLKKLGSKIYITSPNRNGHVTITSDGKTLTVKTQK